VGEHRHRPETQPQKWVPYIQPKRKHTEIDTPPSDEEESTIAATFSIRKKFETGNRKAKMSRWLLALILVALLNGSAIAQQQSEIDAVKTANQAFYTALSARDVASMQKVWSSDADIQNLGPRDKAFTVGWDTMKNGFGRLFDSLAELNVSMAEPRVKIVGSVAWASGIEQAQRKDKKGATSNGTNLATNIFQKQDGRWLMVHHHASLMPQ
jgi:ketosteroid isomerase-like protein